VLLVGVDRVGVLLVGVERVGVDLVGVLLVGVERVGVDRVGVVVRVGVELRTGSDSSVEVDPHENRTFFFGSSFTSRTGEVSFLSIVPSPFGVLGKGMFGVSTSSVGFVLPGRIVPPPVFPPPFGMRGDPIPRTGMIGGCALSLRIG